MIKHTDNHNTATKFNPAKSVVSVLRSVVIAYIFLIICFALLALAYTYTNMPQKSLTVWIDILSAISLIVGGFSAAGKVNTLGYLHGAASGLICSGIRIVLGIAVFGSHISDRGIIPTLLLGTVIAAVGGIAGVNTQKRNKKNKKRK